MRIRSSVDPQVHSPRADRSLPFIAATAAIAVTADVQFIAHYLLSFSEPHRRRAPPTLIQLTAPS
jgi:hypothetical protein